MFHYEIRGVYYTIVSDIWYHIPLQTKKKQSPYLVSEIKLERSKN